MITDNDLLSIQQARILAENAHEAQKKLASFPQETLDCIVEAVADAVEKHAAGLAAMSHEETGFGSPQDKWIKNQFVCSLVRGSLRGMRCVGVLGEDEEHGIMEIGVPLGVIAALCPATSPVSTTIYKTLLAIKSGNAIVFAPHPRAGKCMGAALDIMIKAASEAGLPEGCLSYIGTVAKSGTIELMRHPCVSLVLVSGVPCLYPAARDTGKSVIYGGTASGPAFIERSADVESAVRDVIRSKTFDNGIAPSTEHSLVVDAHIDAMVRKALADQGGYFMDETESLRLADLFYYPDGSRKSGSAGQCAASLAQRASIAAPENVRLLLAERKYVTHTDPYCRGILAPALAYYVEDDWMHACEKCIELLLYERNAHTLVVHSKDREVIMQFALKKPVGRLLVNTPAALGGIGATTNLFPAMTLGSGSAGYGITSDNVSPMNLMYKRKVGRGVRRLDGGAPVKSWRAAGPAPLETDGSINTETLQRILTATIRALG
jgi:acyl-CoA reductase-like NAD-dependent aldehyde dehydrogenase